MLTITHPLVSQVVQRNADNHALVEVRGTCDTTATEIQVRFWKMTEDQDAQETPWYRVAHWLDGFAGRISVPAGWWRIEVRQFTHGEKTGFAFQPCFGVGEVFAVFGHSIAQGGAPFTKGAQDWRVVCINHSQDGQLAKPLPFEFQSMSDNAHVAPFGGAPYAWAKLGDALVKRLRIPVLFFNCAHGGTNIEMAWKSIFRMPFEHWFCRFHTGQPYRPLALTLQHYIPRTGIRAVLCQHGINDDPTNAKFYNQLRDLIRFTRETYNLPNLGWVHMMESKPGVGGFENIQAAIARLWKEEPHIHPGPDFAEFTKISVGRPDTIHLTCESDLELYGDMWSRALTDDFFKICTPIPAGTQPPLAVAVKG